MTPEAARAELLRRSRLAAGAALICVLGLAETVLAHQARPSPWSVWVWAALGGVGAVALLASVWFRRHWRRATQSVTAEELTGRPSVLRTPG